MGEAEGENGQRATSSEPVSQPALALPAAQVGEAWSGTKESGAISLHRLGKSIQQMKPKSCLFWPHQMLGATQSVSQCERRSGKARDFLTDHPDSFQRERRCCCCTSQDGSLGSSQGMSSHPALSSFAQPQQPVLGVGDTSLDWDLGRNSREPCISWHPQQPDFALSPC